MRWLPNISTFGWFNYTKTEKLSINVLKTTRKLNVWQNNIKNRRIKRRFLFTTLPFILPRSGSQNSYGQIYL